MAKRHAFFNYFCIDLVTVFINLFDKFMYFRKNHEH